MSTRSAISAAPEPSGVLASWGSFKFGYLHGFQCSGHWACGNFIRCQYRASARLPAPTSLQLRINADGSRCLKFKGLGRLQNLTRDGC